jgi:hypothetical protein
MLWGRMVQKTCPHRFSRSANMTVSKKWDVLYQFRIWPPVICARCAYECHERFGAGTWLVWCSKMLGYTQMVHYHSLACILSPTRCLKRQSPLCEVHVVMQRYPKLILTHGSSVKCLTIDYRGHVMHPVIAADTSAHSWGQVSRWYLGT